MASQNEDASFQGDTIIVMRILVARFASTAVALALGFSLIPQVVSAFPFGGPIVQIIFCHNNAIYAAVGPPRGGPYIWTPQTKTDQFGRPSHVGQYLLGLAAPPYYCLVSREPIIVWSGILITMMGSSGPGAPRYNPPPPTTGPYPPPPTQPTSPPLPGSPTMGHVAISEVFYGVDSSHGTDPDNEWVEIYNGTANTINVSGWTVSDSATTRTIPNGSSVAPNSFALIVANANTKTIWQFPSATPVINLGTLIGNGLSSAGDEVFLRDSAGNIVDSVSWGSDNRVYNPAIPSYADGHSLARKQLQTDNHSPNDWFDLNSPSPGR